MSGDSIILKHYEKLARLWGLGPRSSIQDLEIRQTEIEFILGEVFEVLKKSRHKNLRVLEIGCGNGHLLEQISLHFNQLELFGIEFTPELFELARSRQIPRCQILNADVRKLESFEALGQEFDIIITERVIINLLTWPEQLRALENLSSLLKVNGRYVMVESFSEPWAQMNEARKEMGLPPVAQSAHNRFLNEKVTVALSKLGLKEVRGQMPHNSLSTHFYLTRVFHPSVRPHGGKTKESHFVRFFKAALPRDIGNYSPIQLRVFERL